MPDFIDLLNVEKKLKDSIKDVLKPLEEKQLKELLKTEYYYGITKFFCPFCPKSFESTNDLLLHIQKTRWEFDKLTSHIETAPRYFEYIDLLEEKDNITRTKVYWKLRKWILCCKLMEKINPCILFPNPITKNQRKDILYKAAALWQIK